MGQQQLLLIVLGVIIVGIAIAVGISMFKSNAQSSNRDQVINDLNNLAAKAQQYFRKPVAMAGGGQSFANFGVPPKNPTNPPVQGLSSTDTVDANGHYAVLAAAGVPTFPYTTYGTATANATKDSCVIVGVGTEIGNNGKDPVQAYVTVTNNTIYTTVQN